MSSKTLAATFVLGVKAMGRSSIQFFQLVPPICMVRRMNRINRMNRIPFELRDMWPESTKAVGAVKDSMPIRFLERIEMFLYRKA